MFEKAGGPGEFDFATIAVWGSKGAIEAARTAMIAKRGEAGFDREEMFARLEIRADLANYERMDI